MSFTYQDPNNNTRDQVRFLAQDTTETSASVTDEEITWLLSSEPNVWFAAARIADLKASNLAGVTRKKVGDLELWQDAEHYTKLAASLRLRGASKAAPYAGGISRSDKSSERSQTDAPVKIASIGMHDNPGIASTST